MNNNYDIVYLLKHKNIPYTKIGFTSRNDLSKRINELNTASPTGIEKVAEFHVPKGKGRAIEKSLHAQYSSFNSNLEWYKLSDKQILDITNWINRIIKK